MPLSLQSDYDYLQRVAKQLSDHADEVRIAMLRIQQHVHSLEDGGWLGQAADRFYDDMHAATLPFLKQLDSDLDQTGTDTARLITLFQQSDERSRTYFTAGGAGGISDPQALARASKVDGFTIKQQVAQDVGAPQLDLAGTGDTDASGFFPGNTKYSNIKLTRASESGDPHEAKLPRPITVDDVTMKRGVIDADAQMQEGGVTGFTRKVIGPTKALPEVDDEVIVGFEHGDNGSLPPDADDDSVAKKLPGKRTPPTVTLKRGKNNSME